MSTPERTLPDTLFVALTGGPGSGKTALGRMLHAPPLEEYPRLQEKYRKIQTHPMRSILRFAGLELSPGEDIQRTMREFHYLARLRGQDRKIMEQLHQLQSAEGIHVIDSVRHQSDALFIVQELGGIVLGLECDTVTREQRFMLDDDDEKHQATTRGTDARRKAFREAEYEMWGNSDDLYRSNISMCLEYARANGTTINASGSKTETFTNCLTFVQDLVVQSSIAVEHA